MYQVAGAILVAAAFIVNQISYSTIHLQRAIVDPNADKHAGIEYLSMLDEHRYFIAGLFFSGLALFVVGIIGDLRRRKAA